MAETHAELKAHAKRSHHEKHAHMGLAAPGSKADEKSDKSMIAAAIGQHEAHDHPGKPKTRLRLKDGGVAEGHGGRKRLDRKMPGSASPAGRTPEINNDEERLADRHGGAAIRQASGGVAHLADGGMAKGRKGHKGGTKVNVLVAPQGGGDRPVPVPVPAGGPMGGAMPPPRPPMPPPGGGMPPGGGGMPPGAMGGMPPRPPMGAGPPIAAGVPMRRRGGRVQHHAEGGAVHLTAGSGSGEGREEKNRAAARSHESTEEGDAPMSHPEEGRAKPARDEEGEGRKTGGRAC
jgi:hypothetical protein